MAYKPMEVPKFTFVDEHKVIRPPKHEKGWPLEFNHVIWGDSEEPKYDIRSWSSDHKIPGRKGVTLTKDDCKSLRNILIETFGRPEDDDQVEIPDTE